MNINPNISMFKSRISLSNIASKHTPKSISISYNSTLVRNNLVIDNIRLLKNNSDYLLTGVTHVDGVLKTDDKELVSYSPVYLYSTTTGVLLSKSFTDEYGYYRFNHLRPGFSYMIVAYDRSSVKNATIIEFTLKEENV